MIKHLSLVIVMVLALATPALSQSAATDPAKVTGKITVAAAANIASVGAALKAAFLAKYPKAGLDFVFGASGALTTQIQNGGPFQVFMSADAAFPKKLSDGGLTAGLPVVYANGKLILFSLKLLDFKRGLSVLADAGVDQFAIANPEIAPYGKAAQESLAKAGLWEKVKSKSVIAQSITQAQQFTLGATGLGLINKSALYTKDLAAYTDKEGVNWIEVDPTAHAPIEQAFVVLKSAASDPTALAFAAFLSSPEAKEIFRKAGYALP